MSVVARRDALRRALESEKQPWPLLRWVGLIVVFMVVFQAVFHLTIGNIINGLTLGALYGIIAVGIILIYRSLRIINFATAALGAVPAILAFVVDIKGWLNYWQALPIAVVGGALSGVLVDFVVMRRFARGSRLIATVATIGIAQSFAILAFFIPIWMGQSAGSVSYVPTPWSRWRISDSRGVPIVTGNQVFAVGAAVVAALAVWAFLRYSRIGIALRAASENSDRAGLLGIPVASVQTVAWGLAGGLAGLAIYGQGPLIGIPRDTTLGFDTLLYALAAGVIVGMEGIWLALGAGLAIGLIIFGSGTNYGDNDLALALMLPLILLALLARRKQLARAYMTGVATWREVKIFPKVPSQLVHLPEVRLAKWGVALGFLTLAIMLPLKIVSSDDVSTLTLLPLYGMVAVSLVVLTGWAGQISLGQFGLVGMAAAVAGGLVANHGINFFVALGIGIAVGAVSAVIIGIPALRIQGLYLAVTTLAFGYVVQYFMLNNHYFVGAHIMPSGYASRVLPPILYGRLDLSDYRVFYFVCLALLLLVMGAAMSFRRFRSGRVLIAARDNPRAAMAYGINITSARLAAFAISGGIAGVAGVMFAYQEGNVVPDSYSVANSILVFLAAAIGGLGSLPIAVLGTMLLEATNVFGPHLYSLLGRNWASVLPLLLTGPLLVLLLIINPGGTAESVFNARDRLLRWVAARRGLHVPSLIADSQEAERGLGFRQALRDATQGLGHERQPHDIICPLCHQGLTLAQARSHPHLQAPAAQGSPP